MKDMRNYWSKISDRYLDSDKLGWGAVIYAGMPLWFNRFFDNFQRKTFNVLTRGINLQDKNVLDVGCGVGRWCLLFKQKKSNVTGIDIERKMLEKAKADARLKGVNFKQMSLEKLDFENKVFDFVNSVTVLQHMSNREKRKAIKEICRVTKKRGHISIIELIDMSDDAPHVFPLPYGKWVKEFEDNNCKLIKSSGCEYSPLLRFLRYLQYLLTGKKTIEKKAGKVKIGKLKWLILKIVILLSYPIEEICRRIFPARLARHGGFLFQKL